MSDVPVSDSVGVLVGDEASEDETPVVARCVTPLLVPVSVPFSHTGNNASHSAGRGVSSGRGLQHVLKRLLL